MSQYLSNDSTILQYLSERCNALYWHNSYIPNDSYPIFLMVRFPVLVQIKLPPIFRLSYVCNDVTDPAGEAVGRIQ
jgi:hypothetical protein